MSFADFADVALLKEKLDKIVNPKRVKGLAIGLYCDGTYTFAAAGDESVSNFISESTPVNAGCISKPLTATLVAHALSETRIELDTDINDILSTRIHDQETIVALSQIKLRHLLNHTHGLDDSLLKNVPRQADGFVDVNTLCRELTSVRPLASPGQMFSYCNAGMWLSAAILEHIYSKPYTQLLQESLLSTFRIATHSNKLASGSISTAAVCPATGENLRMSVRELLALVCYQLDSTSNNANSSITTCLSQMRDFTFQPPGWQSKLRKICLGWNNYGGGWFGHNAKYDGQSAVLRFSPEQKVGIAIAGAQEESSHEALGTIFGSVLTEFNSMQPPKYLVNEQWSATDPSKYLGTYQNASMAIVIDVAANKSLRVRVFKQSEQRDANTEPLIKRYLKAAEGDVFFSMPSEPLAIPFVQFLDQDSDQRYRYIHNGRIALPRV